jgi:hypothetical protein
MYILQASGVSLIFYAELVAKDNKEQLGYHWTVFIKSDIRVFFKICRENSSFITV